MTPCTLTSSSDCIPGKEHPNTFFNNWRNTSDAIVRGLDDPFWIYTQLQPDNRRTAGTVTAQCRLWYYGIKDGSVILESLGTVRQDSEGNERLKPHLSWGLAPPPGTPLLSAGFMQ